MVDCLQPGRGMGVLFRVVFLSGVNLTLKLEGEDDAELT